MFDSKLFFLPLLALTLGCSAVEPPSPAIDEGPVSIITGKSGGTKLSEFFSQTQQSDGMPVNALLWRASLDVVSFVPLGDIDTFGGSIVTDWYSLPKNTSQRIKIAVFIVGRELRSDAVSARVYVQNQIDALWVQSGRDEELERKLEDLILTRARELRSSMIEATVE
jgi:hypothetical protein